MTTSWKLQAHQLHPLDAGQATLRTLCWPSGDIRCCAPHQQLLPNMHALRGYKKGRRMHTDSTTFTKAKQASSHSPSTSINPKWQGLVLQSASWQHACSHALLVRTQILYQEASVPCCLYLLMEF
jgi:hypothetical protein